MTQFEDFGLAEPLLKALTKAGIETPTPIQAEAIPAIMQGRDILGVAQTGTGKTAAFALPLLHAATDRALAERHTCHALVLTPTRELAAQVLDSIRSCGKLMKYSATLIVGGVRHVPQKKAIERGQDIIVATPGRLEDFMSTGFIDLSQTTTLVLDEADQMLDMGFAPAMKRIAEACAPSRQTVLLSATMPKPIRKLAQELLTDPAEISVARESKPSETIEQRVMYVDAAKKRDHLTTLFAEQEFERAIVFTRTKHGADRTAYHLSKAGLKAQALHGDKSQQQRERTMKAFRSGRTDILVATDVAARGLDISDVPLVVNFELPVVAEAYVHRIGRTGRAGRKGTAVSLCDKGERNLLRSIERVIGMRFNEDGLAVVHDFSEEERNRSFDEQRKAGARRGGPKRGAKRNEGRRNGPKRGGARDFSRHSDGGAQKKVHRKGRAGSDSQQNWDPIADTRAKPVDGAEASVSEHRPKPKPRKDKAYKSEGQQQDARAQDSRPQHARKHDSRPQESRSKDTRKTEAKRPSSDKPRSKKAEAFDTSKWSGEKRRRKSAKSGGPSGKQSKPRDGSGSFVKRAS